MEKIWLKHYPKGVPAEIDVNEYASVRDVFEESVAKYADAPGVSRAWARRSRSASSTRCRPRSAPGCRRRAARKGARVALMMPNILQYPVCLFGTLRAGCTVVNVNPLYTARELEHQLNDSGAEVIVVVENFAHTLQEVVGKTQGARRSIVTSIGELLGFKGLLVDFVLRHVKKMVPAWTLPGAIRLSDALAEGRSGEARARAARRTTTSRSCSTRAARPAWPRARCCCTGTSSPTCCRRARGCSRSSTPDSREIIITPLPLYHIFSLTANCLVFMTLGGENVLIPNPRDIPGFVKEMAQVPVHRVHRRQHAVQRARQQRGVREARFLGAADHAGRRHGGAGGGRRASGSRSPACR